MTSMSNIFDAPFLERRAANFAALTPLSFLARAAAVYPGKIAVVHGERRYTYAEFYRRCCRLADALRRRGIGLGDTVSVMAPNVPAMLEAHYGIAMAGGVLNALNYRLDARSIAFILVHGGTKLLIADREYSAPARCVVTPRPSALRLARAPAGRSSSTSTIPSTKGASSCARWTTRPSSLPAIPRHPGSCPRTSGRRWRSAK